MKIGIMAFVAFVVALSLLTAIAVADFVGTRVFFIMRHAISFTVTLPDASSQASTNASAAPAGLVYTSDVEFNITNASMAWVNASVAPCCTNQQDGTDAIFLYRNTGTIAINISLAFNGTTMPPGVNVSASNGTGPLNNGSCNFEAGLAGIDRVPDGSPSCTCKNVTNTASTFIGNLNANQEMKLFVWATFDNFPATAGSVGDGAYTRNLTHSSRTSSGS